MVSTSDRTHAGEVSRRSRLAQIGADLGYVLPGFVISLPAFVLLVTLFAASVATLVIWIGALLLPATLFLASSFAAISRRRLNAWGVRLSPPRYRPRGQGVMANWQWVLDPRRWLDLIFETVVAFPLRIVTFSVAITWIALALGGVTWSLWGFYLPIPEGELMWPGEVLVALGGGAVSQEFAGSFLFEAMMFLVIGALFLITLPFVLRGLAALDAKITAAALDGGEVDSSGHVQHLHIARVYGHETQVNPASSRGEQVEGGPSAQIESAATLSASAWAWIATSLVAITAVAVGWPLLAAVYGAHPAIAMIVAVSQAASLVVVLRWPALAVLLAALAAASIPLLSVVKTTGDWPWVVPMLITQCAFVFVVALRRSWWWALSAWAVPQIAVIAVVTFVHPMVGALDNLILCISVSAGAGILGILIRLWGKNNGALRLEQRVNAELSARQRDLDERNRVARELHDVVAHSMSVIAVQATSAKYRVAGVDDAVAQEFESIAASSRVALGEMRGILASLRADESAAAPLAPQPLFADLPSLIEMTRQSGADIHLSGDPVRVNLSPATGLTAYRVVQEALSNALRHAPGAAIRIDISSTETELKVAITNDAASRNVNAGHSVGSGLGLAGMKDRVTALGGTVTANPTPEGGFVLRASLPLG